MSVRAAADAEGLAVTLVRLALRDDREFDYAIREIVTRLIPHERTSLIRVQATLTASLLHRAPSDVTRARLLDMYERGLA